MISRPLFALCAAAGALTACQSVAAPQIAVAHAAISASVDLAIGGTAIINGMKITPLSIVEDSRCPANANCVWAGRLLVSTRIESQGGGEELQLNLEMGKPVSVYGGWLTLANARPAKIAGETLEPRDYRFLYRFQKP